MRELQEYISTVTSKGQVTIPVAVREILGIEPRDKIVFRVVDGRVEVGPLPMTLEGAYGSVSSLSQPEDFAAMRKIVRLARAESFADRMEG